MPDTQHVIELTAALSPDYESAFKAASDEAKALGSDLAALEKREAALTKLRETDAKRREAAASGNEKAASRLSQAYEKQAKKLGMAGKTSEQVSAELKTLRSRMASISANKKALDASAEISRTARQVQRLQRAYDKLKTPALARQLDATKAKAKGLGIQLDTKPSGLGGRFSALSGNLKGMAEQFAQSNPVVGNLSKAFGGIPPAAAGAVAAVAAVVIGAKKAHDELEKLSTESIKNADELVKMTDAMGISVESYQRLDYAMQRGGASSEGFSKAMRNLDVAVADAREGNKTAVENLKRFGVSLSDIKKKNPEEIFLQIADSLSKIEDPVKRAQAGAKLFGREGYRIAHAMSVGSAALLDLGDEAQRTGWVFSEEFGRRAEYGADQMTLLETNTEGFKRQLGEAASDAKIRKLEALNEEWERNRDSIQLLSETAQGFQGFMTDLEVSGIRAAGSIAQGWKAAVESFALGLDWWVTSIKEAAEAVSSLYNSLVDLSASGWGWLADRVHDVKDLHSAGVEAVAGGLSKADAFFSGTLSGRADSASSAFSSAGGTVIINNNIDARGAAPGAGEDVSRAVSSGDGAAMDTLRRAFSEVTRVSYSGGAR